MVRFTSAVAAALAAAVDPSDREIYRHPVRLEVPVVRGVCNAPKIVQQVLQRLKTDETDISFRGASLQPIDTEVFPLADKPTFDTIFSSYSAKKKNGEFVVLTFEIRTVRPLRALKESVWDFLVEHNLYLNSSPGPPSKVNLKPMGFITKLHPKTASLTAATYDLATCIEQGIQDADDNTLLELGITTDQIDVTLSSDRLRGTFRKDNITSNGVVVFSEDSLLEKNYTLLEHFSEGMWAHGHVFVPFSLRREQPEVYGKYLALQNVFLKDHRNISICGIGPEALDYEDSPPTQDSTTVSESIWQKMAVLPGVYRVDPTKRTVDLGKWNISCDSKYYLDIIAWIDTNLLPLFHKVPDDIRSQYSFTDFPTPARLSRNFRVHGGATSVRSALTGTSSRYQQTLVSNLSNYDVLPKVERSPWQNLQARPMSEIKYSAEDFPALKNTTDTHTTATETQAGQTEVSAITESAIHSAVKTAFAKLQADHKVMEEQWKLKFDNLEKQMQELSQSVASDVIAAMLKSDDMPFLDKTSFFKQMNHQTTTMTAIMETSNMQVTDIKRMFMTIESRLRDGPTTVSSPPRKLRSMVANRATEPTDSPNSNLSNPPPSTEAGMKQ
jgi:hypothetical protein